MSRPLTVVKVGGSLYDLPDLSRRLPAWLKQAAGAEILLVPGGGASAHVIRELDAVHQIGDEKAHWLALDALQLNGRFLASLLPCARFVDHPEQVRGSRMGILNPAQFLTWDESSICEGRLPHIWAVTSDSVAARAAVCFGADHLFLLKSITIPSEMDWETAAAQGFVDQWFARTIRLRGPYLRVHSVNLRDWRP